MTSIARTKAEEKFEQARRREQQFLTDREKARQNLTDKMARLRALRLAKEATDKEEAARKALVKLTGRRRTVAC